MSFFDLEAVFFTWLRTCRSWSPHSVMVSSWERGVKRRCMNIYFVIHLKKVPTIIFIAHTIRSAVQCTQLHVV